MVTGEARGKVAYTWNDEILPSFPVHLDYPAWYEGWLDEFLCSVDHVWYGFGPSGDSPGH
ncbi:hypothetical protein GCM10027570_09660 [Streptomonospora sediminis]